MPLRPRPRLRTPTPLSIAHLLASPRSSLRFHLPSPSLLSFHYRRLIRSPYLRFFGYTLALLPSLIFISQNTFQLTWITGRSMSPFFNHGFDMGKSRDLVLLKTRWGSGNGKKGIGENGEVLAGLRRGDVVAFWSPGNPERLAVKRVVALEGDTVVERGRVGVKAKRRKRVPEPDARKAMQAKLQEQEVENEEVETAQKTHLVPKGHIWVEGDNPDGRFNLDSNTFGPISSSLVVGHVLAGIWPKPMLISWQDWKGCERVMKGRFIEEEEQMDVMRLWKG